MRGRLALAALVLLALGAACSSSDSDDAGRLTVDGTAEVAAPGGQPDEERGGRTLKYGERVKVLEGTATIRLDQGRELELRTGTNVVLEKVDLDGDRLAAQPLLLERDLLVHAPPGARLTVSTEGAEVIVSGNAAVSRGAAVVVSSFEGDVELRSGDQSTTIPALRQLTVPADGGPAGTPVPLSYNADDPWNRRFLSAAIELGNELEARSKGFTAQLGADGRTQEFLVTLLPTLATQPGFAGLYDAARPPGESLVGAAIVLEGTRGTFAERWVGVFGFRDQGAQWGLVAYDQGVTRAPLLAAVDAAIGRGPRTFEPVPLPDGSGSPDGEVAAPIFGGSSGSSGSSGSGSGGTAGGTGPGSGTGAGSVPTTVPPPTPPNPNIGPLNTGIPILDNTINALVETLSGLLRSLGGG